jgi:4-amino-4-deoxy-L-arabinose transferase-like glycosyltransferase
MSLFFIACISGYLGVLYSRIELALFASLAMGCFFWNSKDSSPEVENETIISDKRKISRLRLIFTIALFVFAILFGIGGVYFSRNPESGTVSLILWLISIALIMLAGVIFDKAEPFAWLKRIENLPPEARRQVFIEIAIVFLITEIALLLRVTNLDHFPPSIHGDEGEMGMEALRVLGIGNPITPFGVGWGSFPNLFYYMQAGSIYIFGRNAIGLRMISALFGTACVPLVYLIGRKFWGKIAGFTGAWLIAVSHFSIHYSRLGLNNIESAFFMILFILLFLSSHSDSISSQNVELKKSKPSNLLKGKFIIFPYIAAGLVCGLAQYMYLGSRLILLMALPLYIFLFIRRRINIIQIAVVGVAAILVFAPLGLFYYHNPKVITSRMETVYTLTAENIKKINGPDATLSNSAFLVIQNQLKRNLNFYLQYGDASSFYLRDIPGFDSITALLFWLGLGAVFTRRRRLPEMVLILWLFSGFIFGGVLTVGSPYGPRLLISTSAVFIIAGVFTQRIWNVLNDFFNKFPTARPSFVRVSAIGLSCMLLAILGINMYYYFGIYSKAGMNIVLAEVTKEIILDAPVDHVYLIGNNKLYTNHGTIRFLAGEGKATDLQSPEDLPALVNDGKGITVIVVFSNYDEVDFLEARYPQGAKSSDIFLGHLIFMKYRIPPLNLQ